MDNQPFLTDIKTLRQRARQHIDEGAMTAERTAASHDLIILDRQPQHRREQGVPRTILQNTNAPFVFTRIY